MRGIHQPEHARDTKDRDGAPAKAKQIGNDSLTNRIKLFLILFVVGVLGAAISLWMTLNQSSGEEMVQKMGMQRVANSFENILSIVAIPTVMFFTILTAYALVELYKIYRKANDPDRFRRSRPRGSRR